MTLSEAVCPYCFSGLDAPEKATWHRCAACGSLVNLDAQRAYLRAQEYLERAQESDLTPLNPKRPDPLRSPKDSEALEAFQQTHSALELAFQADLPEEARTNGIAVMAEVTQVLAKRQMLSTLEANYWVNLLIEANTLREQAELEARLATPASGGALRRLRWRLRLGQLRKGLVRLDRRIAEIEETIAFVDVPHARRPAGPPRH